MNLKNESVKTSSNQIACLDKKIMKFKFKAYQYILNIQKQKKIFQNIESMCEIANHYIDK